MFDLDFVNNLRQVLGDNPWLVKSINQNYTICLLRKVEYLSGTNKVDQFSLVEAACNKCLEYESDANDDKYELPI
jgi:hypothetical protein